MNDESLANDSTLQAIQDILHAAMERHQQGDLYEADLLYAQTLHLAPDNEQALRLRGILSRERGDLENSLKFLQRASDLAPMNPEPRGEIALAQMAAGDLHEAELTLRKALQLNPESVKTLTNLGALLHHRGHIRAAIDFYERALTADPDNIEVRCNLAKALVDTGQIKQALAECDTALRKTDGDPYALATRGAVLTDAQQYAAARPILEQATAMNPEDDMALVNLGLACYELDDLPAATQALAQAVKANPYNARAVADLANCLTASGNIAAALELSSSFLQHNPGERLVVAARALALHNDGQHQEALYLTDFTNLVQVFELPCPASFNNLAEFNSVLATLLRNDPSLLTTPTSKSTYGGDQTGELNLHAGELADLAKLFNQAIMQATDTYAAAGLAAHPLMAPAANDWSLRAWGTLLRSGGKQTAHMHPLGWLSGVYYVSVPANLDAAGDEAGWLEFGRPPERFFRTSEPDTRRYEPVAGKLILFPSWFWHQTVPFTADSERISIAFDVMPKSMLRII
jgi:uncharacterized protein (TIGR02466 family)